jgi:hypothetical protein
MRRIVFSIGFSRQWSPALLVFKSTKSRWNFYKKILRGSFHTAWVKRRNTRREQKFSGSPSKPDIAQRSRHVRFVPNPDSLAMTCHVLIFARVPTTLFSCDFQWWKE